MKAVTKILPLLVAAMLFAIPATVNKPKTIATFATKASAFVKRAC